MVKEFEITAALSNYPILSGVALTLWISYFLSILVIYVSKHYRLPFTKPKSLTDRLVNKDLQTFMCEELCDALNSTRTDGSNLGTAFVSIGEKEVGYYENGIYSKFSPFDNTYIGNKQLTMLYYAAKENKLTMDQLFKDGKLRLTLDEVEEKLVNLLDPNRLLVYIYYKLKHDLVVNNEKSIDALLKCNSAIGE